MSPSRFPWRFSASSSGSPPGGMPSSASPTRCGDGVGGHVPVFGLPLLFFGRGFFTGGQSGFFHGLGVFCAGIVLFFAAPWVVRAVVYLDRRVMRVLLAPDALAARVRVLEQARAQSVDSSAATLRRIERDLHDGTQAQLVALAMRLGMAKEKLAEIEADRASGPTGPTGPTGRRAGEQISTRSASWSTTPTAAPRRPSSSSATSPAGYTRPPSMSDSKAPCPPWPHAAPSRPSSPSRSMIGRRRRSRRSPTSASPSSSPTWPSTPMPRRPASRARTTASGCAWSCATTAREERSSRGSGSRSSGLVGLTDRVHAVDGRLDIASPPRGPTVVTVDLPLHA